MSIFGPIIDASRVEDAVLSLLQVWLPTYLSEVERQAGMTAGQLARPRSWQAVNDVDNWPENQLPAVFVVPTGTTGEPERLGDGTYSTWWAFGVVAVTPANDEVHARRNAQLYTAAIRALLLHRQSLGGLGTATVWTGERFDAGSLSGRNRTLGVGSSEYRVNVMNVVQTGKGPIAPDPKPDSTEPYDDEPVIQVASPTLINRGITS